MVLAVYLISASVLVLMAFVAFPVLQRRDYERRRRLTWLTVLVASLVFFLWGGFPYIYGPSDWPVVHVGPIPRAVGWITLVGGLGILLVGMAQLGPQRFLGQAAGPLQQTGLYRLSRNPQIVGCGLYGIGFAVLWPSWYAAGWALLFGPIAHMMVLGEEQHLLAVHGEEYERYRGRVPRYVGLPRGR